MRKSTDPASAGRRARLLLRHRKIGAVDFIDELLAQDLPDRKALEPSRSTRLATRADKHRRAGFNSEEIAFQTVHRTLHYCSHRRVRSVVRSWLRDRARRVCEAGHRARRARMASLLV